MIRPYPENSPFCFRNGLFLFLTSRDSISSSQGRFIVLVHEHNELNMAMDRRKMIAIVSNHTIVARDSLESGIDA
jgi:hypothetical protein